LDVALRLLSQRAHGEHELRCKLARRGCPVDQVDAAIRRVRELGYVDDAAFAQALVAHRAQARGPALIAAELTARGIDRKLAGRAVARLERDELAAAARRLAGDAARRDVRRAAARLRRLGYPTDVVREALAIDPAETGVDTGEVG
jgi:regulatory protein